MNEPMCVCGHPVARHTAMRGEERGCRAKVELSEGVYVECDCDSCRPCLPWPDAEGWWVRESDGEHVKAYEGLGEFWIATLQHPGMSEESATPDRYCRCEPNPFAKGRE